MEIFLKFIHFGNGENDHDGNESDNEYDDNDDDVEDDDNDAFTQFAMVKFILAPNSTLML